MHGCDEGQPVKPLCLAVFHVAQEEPEHYEPPEDNENLVARVAAVEENKRRDHEQNGGAKRSNPPKVTPPGKQGEDHHPDAKQRCGYTGREVRIAEEEV